MTRLEKLESVAAAARFALQLWERNGLADMSGVRAALAALDTPDAEAGETVTLAVWRHMDGGIQWVALDSEAEHFQQGMTSWTRLGTVTLPLVRERGA